MSEDPLSARVSDLANRVVRLETDHRTLSASHTAHTIEFVSIKKDIKHIMEGQEKTNTGISRVLWAIGLAILGTGVTFVLNGGLVIAN